MNNMFIPKGNPFQVCSFLYKICNAGPVDACAVRARIKQGVDLIEWQNAVAKAYDCPYAGNDITYVEYINKCHGHVAKRE